MFDGLRGLPRPGRHRQPGAWRAQPVRHVWLYGGDIASVETTIREGRNGVMPAWRTRLGDNDAKAIAAWIYAQSHPADGGAH